MTIAFNSVLDEVDFTSTSPVTQSFTNTAGNFVLVCFTLSAGDTATGVTYGGQSMTQWSKIFHTTNNAELYIYALPAAPTGSNNIVVTFTGGSKSLRVLALSYSGVLNSITPDAVNTGTPANGVSMAGTVTTVTDNCWVVLFPYGNNSISATSGCVPRSSASNPATFDNNSSKSPAGLVTETVNTGGTSSAWAYIMVSFAPALNNSGFLAFM